MTRPPKDGWIFRWGSRQVVLSRDSEMIRPRIAGHPIFRASEARDSTGLQPRGGPVPKVGAVQYLNTRPLVHGLSEHRLDLCYDLPSRLADRLADRSLDVALIPTVELFRSPGHTIVSNACIGCLGPVMSVSTGQLPSA